MGGSAPAARSTLRAAVVVGAVLAAFALRVVTTSARELREAQVLEDRGELQAAIVHYGRAARWYAPGSPYHGRAMQRLAELGRQAEGEQDVQTALAAYRSLRGAILAARSFYLPERARLEAANARIADLQSVLPPAPRDADKSRAQVRDEQLALLSRVPGPDPWWTGLSLLGFAGWVGGALLLSVRGIDDADRWVPGVARRWGTLVALGFGLFVLGLALA